jgi:hypothetical protein
MVAGALATAVAMILAVGLARAQPAGAAAGAPKEAPRVDWSHAQSIYRLVDQWCHAGIIDTKQKPESLWASDVSGVCVTLRWLGKTMGVGQAMAESALAPSAGTQPGAGVGNPVDLAALAQSATVLALSDVEARLIEARQAAPGAKVITLAELAARGELLVDVQVARTMHPITLATSDPPGAIYDQFAPGYHGLSMFRSVNDKISQAVIWPANCIAEDRLPQMQLVLLLHEMQYQVAPDQLDKQIALIGRRGGPAIARFEVIHLARPEKDAPVMQLVRGNAALPSTQFNSRTLESMADRLTEHLLRCMREDGSMSGTYLPTSNKWEPETAPPAEQAVATYALGRRLASAGDKVQENPSLLTAQDAVYKSLDHLTKELLNPKRPAMDAPAMAITLMALCETPNVAGHKAQRDDLAAQLLVLANADGSFRSTTGAPARPGTTPAPAGEPTHVLIATALASYYEQTRDAKVLGAVRKSQAWLWDAARAKDRGATRPWIAYLEFRMHRLGDPVDNPDPKVWATHAKALGEMVNEVRGRQVTAAPALTPGLDDLVGGFDTVLDRHGDAALPEPDYRTAYDVIFLAAMLREAPPNDRNVAMSRVLECSGGVRFLAELMFDDPSCYYVTFKQDALGGVRASLWDNRLGLLPSGVALLATVELQQAMNSVAAVVP